MKNKNRKIIKTFTVSFILLLCTTFVTIALGSKIKIVHADTATEQSSSQTYDLYNAGFNLHSYTSNYIGTLARIEKVSGNYQVVNTDKDDPITQIIPRNYFYTLGDELILEDDYGYYINTESYGNGNFISTAMIFEIETNSDLYETTDRVIVTVSPLFEYEYLCLKGQSSLEIGQYTVSYSLDSYCVIPYPVLSTSDTIYKQTKKFYIKDVSFAASLYNEQHLNAGDYGYSALEDYGSYFTAFDYEYNGKVREYGEFPTQQTITTVLDITSLGLSVAGVIPGVGSIASAIGALLGAATTIADGVMLIEDVGTYLNGEIVQANKKVTTSCFYQNRKDQLNNYKDKDGNPSLAKIATVTCNTGIEQSLWYGVGDYARAYFYVGHGDGDGVVPYNTRFVDNIALKIVDSRTDEVVKVGFGLNSKSIRNIEYKSLSIDKVESVYMLPNGQDNFNFKPKYESDYEISIKISSVADVYINGKTYHGKEISVKTYIESGNGININFSNNNVGLTGTILISPNTTNKATKISSNGNYLMKLDLSGVRELKTNNSNIIIENFYTLEDGNLNKYLFNGEINISDTISYPFKEDTYYVVLHNATSNFINSWALDVNEVGKLQIGEENDVTLQASNLNYFRIDADLSSNYMVSLENIEGNEYNYIFIDSNLINLNGISYLDDRYIIAMDANNTYYIGVKTGKNENHAKILINTSDGNYQWKITGGDFGEDGVTTSDRAVNVVRGYTYKLTFIMNGAEKNSGLFSQETETSWGYYGISINSTTGEIAIPASCPIGGNGIIIKAWASENENTSYNHTIRLIPTFENKLNDVSLKNSSGITLQIDAQQYISKIDYKISGPNNYGNFVDRSYTMSFDNYSNQGAVKNINILPEIEAINSTYVVNFTITITQIYYYDALKNEKRDATCTYTFKVNNFFEAGNGTSSSPYLINSYRHLDNIRKTALEKIYYKLTDNISCSPLKTWTPIYLFSGYLDGNNYSITEIEIDALSGGNIGFVEVNNGLIENLCIGTYFTVSDQFSNVNVGVFAGINKGTISKCTLIAIKNRPFFVCNAKGDSYMGCFVGSNERNIVECYGGDWLEGSCNMGAIAGKNSGRIDNCTASSKIIINYRDYNACVGGIVGLQTSGEVTKCRFIGRILLNNYYSEKYNGIVEDRDIQIYAGFIIGYKQGGTLNGNSWELCVGCLGNIVSSVTDLRTITWTTGALWWKKTYTHDQALYFKNAACGRVE